MLRRVNALLINQSHSFAAVVDKFVFVRYDSSVFVTDRLVVVCSERENIKVPFMVGFACRLP